MSAAITEIGACTSRLRARFWLNARPLATVHPRLCRMNLEVEMRRLNLPLLLLVGAVSTAVLADDEDLTMEQERDQIGANMEAERKGEQPALNNSGVPSSAATPGAEGSGSSVGSPTTTTGNPTTAPGSPTPGQGSSIAAPDTPTTGQGMPTHAPGKPTTGQGRSTALPGTSTAAPGAPTTGQGRSTTGSGAAGGAAGGAGGAGGSN
ncbi:hypothetical protein L682_00555 [Aquipseudomonas alcaligenes OT 69]|nr:hypothetical protein L682_00555 [Pseudomonas alcaligenes OT 69]